jgi:hypothetical protein
VTPVIETKGFPECLRSSLFSHVPPYIRFSMHDVKGKFTQFLPFFPVVTYINSSYVHSFLPGTALASLKQN